MPLGALYPSKSGLMNKHIVKHIVKHSRRPTVSSNTSEGQVRQAVCLWFGLVWWSVSNAVFDLRLKCIKCL